MKPGKNLADEVFYWRKIPDLWLVLLENSSLGSLYAPVHVLLDFDLCQININSYSCSMHSYLQGDRVGICVTQFDAKQVERCLVSSPGHLPTLYGICARC